ncbi:AEC family transporter [Mycoplasmatota bacterium WC30]
MDTFLFSLNAVLPILILIGFGYVLKRIKFLDEHFLQVGNKFVFRIALPSLLFYTIYSIEDLSAINWPVIIYSVVGVLILFIVGLIVAMIAVKDKKQKGVVLQTVFRANYAIIGIPLAQAIGGIEAVQVVALVSVIIVPLINILAVVALSLFVKNEEEQKHPFRTTFIKIFKNPLILAILFGLLVLWIRSYIPLDSVTGQPVFTIENNIGFVYLVIKWIGQIASPLALIVLGGTFEFFAMKDMVKQIFVGTFSRVVLAPLITLSLAVFIASKTSFFNFSSAEYPALIALFASPTAVSGAIMAREMHNDELLSVQLVVWTTTISIITIFITVFIFKSLNLI